MDKDAKSTKKNGVYTFGYKGHIGIDVGSSLIRTRVYTPANEHDSKFTEQLAADFGGALFGDKGYADDRLKKMARQFGWFYCIVDKAKKGQPLSGSQHKRNAKYSRIRCKVEHVFGWMKTQCGSFKASAKSLSKNGLKFDFACMGWNLKQALVLSRRKPMMG